MSYEMSQTAENPGPTTSWTGTRAMELLLRGVAEDEGQDLIEYALVTGFISLVSVTWIINIGTSSNELYDSIGSAVASIPAP